VVYPVPTNETMTKESQRYNRFIRHGGNAISKHICRESNVAILPLNSPCSGLVTHAGEILITGEVSPEEAGGIIPKRSRIKKKKTTDQQAVETTGQHNIDLQTCDIGRGQQLAQLGIS